MEQQIKDLIDGYREQSSYLMEVGNVDGALVYDKIIEDLEGLLV